VICVTDIFSRRCWEFFGLLPSIVHVWGQCDLFKGQRRKVKIHRGAKVQNSKSLKRKKLTAHLLKSIVGTTLIYLLSPGSWTAMGDIMHGSIFTKCEIRIWQEGLK